MAFDAAVLVDVSSADTTGAAMGKGLAQSHQRYRNNSEDDFHVKITLPHRSCESSGIRDSCAKPYFQDLINALALASLALMIRSRRLRASRTLLVRSEKRTRLAGPLRRSRLK